MSAAEDRTGWPSDAEIKQHNEWWAKVGRYEDAEALATASELGYVSTLIPDNDTSDVFVEGATAVARPAPLKLGQRTRFPQGSRERDSNGFWAPLVVAATGEEFGRFTHYRYTSNLDAAWRGVATDLRDQRWHCEEWWAHIHGLAMDGIVPSFGVEFRINGSPTLSLHSSRQSILRWDTIQGIGGVLVGFNPTPAACGRCIGCRSHDHAVEQRATSWVYFIQATDGGSVKIGRSNNPEGRRCALQTGHPKELRILATMAGGMAVERSIHTLFAGDRVRSDGEWFHPSPELIAFIKEIGDAR